MKKPLIFLATPTGKNMNMHAETAAFCSLTAGLPDVLWGHIGTNSAEMSRNNLIEDHEHSGNEYTHVFFVDSDTVPPPDALPTLINNDVDIVTGVTPIWMDDGFYWAVGRENESWIPVSEALPKETFEIVSCGASCLLVRKEVLDDMGWPWFKTEHQPKWSNDGKPVKNGEDEFFCSKAIDKGYKIMANPNVICKHYNQVDLLKIIRSSHGPQ
jgi:hypothetical protein